MRKYIAFMTVLIIAGILTAGCSAPADLPAATQPSTTVNTEPSISPQPSTTVSTEPSTSPQPTAIEDIVPGKQTTDRIFAGVLEWAKAEEGIDTTNEAVSVSSVFGSENTESHIKSIQAMKLTDGTIVGFAFFTTPAGIQATEAGDVIFGENVDFVSLQIEKTAQAVGKNHYTHFTQDCAFFCISDSTDTYATWYMSCRQGRFSE